MHDDISKALSHQARKYLEKVFCCTTHSHLMKLAAIESDTGLNVFEENIKFKEDSEIEYIIDEEIAEYVKAVKEGREPYDPGEHEFDVRTEGERHEIWVRGVATADEWELLAMAGDPRPDKSECYLLFNQLVGSRRS